MTGFGKAVCQLPKSNLIVEIKALNGKTLDVSIKAPSFLREKEQFVRQIVAENLIRGKIDVYLSSERVDGSSQPCINKVVFLNYLKELKEVANQVGLDVGNDILPAIARMPDVFSSEAGPEEMEAYLPLLHNAINEAIGGLMEFRTSEGAFLQAELQNRIRTLRELSGQIPLLETERLEGLKERLLKNLEELGAAGKPDPGRFEQELIFYLEKLDITEEKVRLEKHLDYFEETMANEENAGKKLGFIAQEIGREVNTLGSKANHAGMQKTVIMMKDELEKIKEQLMNVL